jgi:hypothetical protein
LATEEYLIWKYVVLPSAPGVPGTPSVPLVPFSPLITTGVVQFVFKVSSGLIVAVVIQRYPSLDFSGGTIDHPEGVLIVAFNVGGFELLVFTANLNSVNLPS